MIHVRMPLTVSLCCPACREHFQLKAELLNERETLHCPACGMSSGIYRMLEGRLRRRLYQAVRDEMENRIHQLQNSQTQSGS